MPYHMNSVLGYPRAFYRAQAKRVTLHAMIQAIKKAVKVADASTGSLGR